MERCNAKEPVDQAFDQQNRALEDWQLPETVALWQVQCWVGTVKDNILNPP